MGMGYKTNFLNKNPCHVNDYIICAHLIESMSLIDTANHFETTTQQILYIIKRLEKRLNANIFKIENNKKRTPLRIEIIQDKYIDHICEIAKEMDLLERGIFSKEEWEKIYGEKEELIGEVIISSTQTIWECFLVNTVTNFIEKFPLLTPSFYQIDLFINDKQKFNEIFICPLSDDTDIYEYIPFYSFSQKLWASKKYIEKNPPINNVEDLAGQTILFMKNVQSESNFYGPVITQSKLPHIVEKIKIMNVSGPRLLDVLATNGVGIIVCSEETVKLSNLPLVNVLPNFVGEKIDMFVKVNKSFLSYKKCTAAIDFIMKGRDEALNQLLDRNKGINK